MDIYRLIRSLAKSNKYQTLYNLAKEGSFRIFNNNSNYTDNQILFLNYMSFYSSIYIDIAMDYVDEIVLNNDIYEDAYIYYRNKSKGESKDKKVSKQENSNRQNLNNSSTWVFKKPNKKRAK